MRFLTCTGCKFNGDCDLAAVKRADLKGHGIRTIKFACKRRADIFQPGQAALFTTFVSDEDEAHRGGVMEVTYPGHVIKQMGSKVFGFIKPGAEDTDGYGIPFEAKVRGYVKMPLTRVKTDGSRDAANVDSCKWCGQHVGLGDVCGKDPYYTPPSQCLAADLTSDRREGL
ncbi:hypothetical protein OIU35_31405 [Boseaceae bacterium BT-24-1]|nr:hypothetical protein [Boseaceae bacterium BT-24-1]